HYPRESTGLCNDPGKALAGRKPIKRSYYLPATEFKPWEGTMTLSFAFLMFNNPDNLAVRAMMAVDDSGEVVYQPVQVINNRVYTNSEFAYHTLIASLRWAQQNTCESITIRTDQELLVKQVRGEWECRSPRLVPLLAKVKELLNETGAKLEY